MKALISIFIVLVLIYGFLELIGFYNRTARPGAGGGGDDAPIAAHIDHLAGSGDTLSGLPQSLEASLAQAQQGGLEELGKWLKTWSRNVQDPRLAWIELDYIVLLNLKDHQAARERFLAVRNRIGPDSPVAERIRKLEPAYEQ